MLAINTQLSELIMWNSSKCTWGSLANDIQPGPTIAVAPAAQENLFLHLARLSLPPTHPPPPAPWSFLLLVSPSVLTVRLNSLTASCFGSSPQLQPSLPPVKHRKSRCWLCSMVRKLICVLSLNQGERRGPFVLKSDINRNVCCPIAAAIHVQMDITLSQLSHSTVIARLLHSPCTVGSKCWHVSDRIRG